MKRRLVLLSAFLSAVAAALAVWQWRERGAIDPDDAAQVARGAALYASNCAECHGATLEGQPNWQVRRPSGELPAPPHDASGHSWHHTDEQLFAMTKYGMTRVAPPDYKSAMPVFVGRLSDADIRAVLAFIKSRWPDDIRRRQSALSQR